MRAPLDTEIREASARLSYVSQSNLVQEVWWKAKKERSLECPMKS